ncbi:MAG: hypothetical protein HYY76_15880 [Acidobacteria bacterium]|nr:hypothetical protein [Acidobacteriota bacterium]
MAVAPLDSSPGGRRVILPYERPLARRRLLSPAQAAALPSGFTLALLSLGGFDVGRQPPGLFASIVGGAATLVAWTVVWFWLARRQRRTLTLEIVLRKQHYLQACAQAVVLCYWGWSISNPTARRPRSGSSKDASSALRPRAPMRSGWLRAIPRSAPHRPSMICGSS